MGLKYLLLLRFGLVNLVAFALLGAAWAQGLVAKVINADVTNMVILICAIFLIGLILAGYRLWKVSKQLNAAYNYNPEERSRAADFLKKTKGKNATSRANIAQALRLKLFSRIVHIRYISNSLTVLGLIGTVLGFIIALSGVDPDVASNPSAISPMVAQLIEGMSVALYTTLVGSILSVWLGLIYQMLATGTSNLVSQIIELSER
ncbi:MAG: MotA/TolQ/ExbB proton channel family protein [Alphaproteobacteria bacterium]|tara:strand:+ start:559 stop:1173 length:615 start_codon:yes stop_codon:yes gene_type:complete